MKHFVATAILAWMQVTAAVKDLEYSQLSKYKPPMVVLFFNSSSSVAYVSALKELESVEATNGDFRFYKCDVSNDEEARQAGLTEATHLFSWTVDRGVEETHVPLRKLYISRYLSFLSLVPVPESVVDITSELNMRPLLESSDVTPVFTMFYESSCPHCYKAKRGFEQAAGFFQNFLTFAKIDCTLNTDTRSMCASANVSDVPTFVLFTKPLVAKYEGGRSVAEFEMFFQSQKQRRSEVMTSDDALQAFDRVLALNSRQTSNTIDGYPSGKGGGTQCPADCARKIKALEQRIQELAARLDALEAKT